MTREERHFRLRRAYGPSKRITCGDSLGGTFRATTLHGAKELFGA